MDREAALREHLNTTAPIVPSTYNPNLFIVNPHKIKRGSSPEEIIESAEILRAKLITLFGAEAETWTSDFLRVQEMEAKDLRFALNDARSRMEKAVKALPMIKCQRARYSLGVVREFPLRAEMLTDPRTFHIEVPSAGRVFKQTWVPCQRLAASEKLTRLLSAVANTQAEYERLLEKTAQFRSYSDLEKVIKDSFDWNRLGNKHDNETAHAYQAIVNPLYLIGARSKWNDGEYQQQLRDAFDRKALTDYREESESEADDGEYLVLTELEAQAAVLEDIKESVWAFNAEFLAKWIPLKTTDIQRLQEGCENCNEAILALIGSKLDDFVAAAVKADGRGHFLSGYDSKEIKVGNYFIYRSN